MLKSLIAGLAVTFLLGGAALAQTCTTYPNTLTNGTTADATQVMANFNCAALTGNGIFTNNVGILLGSSTVPNASLDVRGNLAIGPTSTGSIANQQTITSDGSGASMRMTSPAGVFLIAGTTPTKLEVSGGAICEAASLFCLTNAGLLGVGNPTPVARVDLGTALNTIDVALYESSGTGFYGMGVNPDKMTFGAGLASISSTPQMVLTDTGYLGIGTTSPGYTLTVNGTAYATGAAGALSDIRHKDKVASLPDGALAIVNRLRPVTFVWKHPTDEGMKGEQIGFIAQEVERVFPSVVLTETNAEKTKDLKYTELIPILAKAIQEQQAEIQALRAEVATLKAHQ